MAWKLFCYFRVHRLLLLDSLTGSEGLKEDDDMLILKVLICFCLPGPAALPPHSGEGGAVAPSPEREPERESSRGSGRGSWNKREKG